MHFTVAAKVHYCKRFETFLYCVEFFCNFLTTLPPSEIRRRRKIDGGVSDSSSTISRCFFHRRQTLCAPTACD